MRAVCMALGQVMYFLSQLRPNVCNHAADYRAVGPDGPGIFAYRVVAMAGGAWRLLFGFIATLHFCL